MEGWHGWAGPMTRDELQALAVPLSDHGVVAAHELRFANADPSAVALRLKGDWQASIRGIYVIDQRELTPVVRGHVAVKHAGEGAVVTGLQAAKWRGLRSARTAPPGLSTRGPVQVSAGRLTAFASLIHGAGIAKTRVWKGIPVPWITPVLRGGERGRSG